MKLVVNINGSVVDGGENDNDDQDHAENDKIYDNFKDNDDKDREGKAARSYLHLSGRQRTSHSLMVA